MLMRKHTRRAGDDSTGSQPHKPAPLAQGISHGELCHYMIRTQSATYTADKTVGVADAQLRTVGEEFSHNSLQALRGELLGLIAV